MDIAWWIDGKGNDNEAKRNDSGSKKTQGLTQEQLAEKLFVTRQAVSLMGAVLPHLKRWNDTHANEARS